MVKIIFNEDHVATCIRASKTGSTLVEGPDRVFKKDEVVTLLLRPCDDEDMPNHVDLVCERGEIFTVRKDTYEVIDTVAAFACVAAVVPL